MNINRSNSLNLEALPKLKETIKNNIEEKNDQNSKGKSDNNKAYKILGIDEKTENKKSQSIGRKFREKLHAGLEKIQTGAKKFQTMVTKKSKNNKGLQR